MMAPIRWAKDVIVVVLFSPQLVQQSREIIRADIGNLLESPRLDVRTIHRIGRWEAHLTFHNLLRPLMIAMVDKRRWAFPHCYNMEYLRVLIPPLGMREIKRSLNVEPR